MVKKPFSAFRGFSKLKGKKGYPFTKFVYAMTFTEGGIGDKKANSVT